jgi:uncharacterized damage-inducible protein DinB
MLHIAASYRRGDKEAAGVSRHRVQQHRRSPGPPKHRRVLHGCGTVRGKATAEATMITTELARMLTRYKAWANEITFSTVAALPEGEATKPRPTLFKNMVHTLNHPYVIDCIFQAHLEGRPHGFTARNTPTHPPLDELWRAVQAMDRWYVELSDRLSDRELAETVRFQYVGGGDGAMTRGEILLHLVNHATYHRGFVADMLNQAQVKPPATDLTVFLRDIHRAAA